ncbi:ABC transporter ATP-binding protein [Candidatus Saccharibacteria bacterium]|nr:ABC transporter ATP-binding protein [Candidatus Saccharibacteria bacterium]
MSKNINLETVKLYWQQIKKYKVSFFIALIAIPVSSVILDTILPYLLSQAVGSIELGISSRLSDLLLLSAAMALIGVLLNFLGFQSMIKHESNVRSDLSIDTLDRLLQKDTSFFNNQKIGALTGRFIDFINAHVGLQDLLMIRTLTFVFNVGLGTFIILSNSLLLGSVVLGLIVFLLLTIRLSIKLRKNLRHARKELIGQVNGMAADTISNNQTVKAFGNEDYELEKNLDINRRYQIAYRKDFRWMSFEGSGRLLLMSIVQIVAIAIIAGLLVNNQISLGVAIFVIAYLQRVASQLFVLGEIVNGYDKLLLQAAPITEMLVEPPRITDRPGAGNLKVTNGVIEFKQVNFAYDDAKDTRVLSDINLSIKAGQRVGLVGPSGAGKTTITKLLMRFNEVTSGSIEIDGQNIQTVTQQSLRRSIAFVSQEPILFHRSLRENISYGKLDATEQELLSAIKTANADEFINKLPDGLETVVGERGVKLSGGQRQRVAIARAILKDAPILILDEATSALDSESEKLIQASLEPLMKNRTSIVIAHRLSTIAKLDRILVIDDGSIVDDGSHRELLAYDGVYAKLWKHQSGGFIEE